MTSGRMMPVPLVIYGSHEGSVDLVSSGIIQWHEWLHNCGGLPASLILQRAPFPGRSAETLFLGIRNQSSGGSANTSFLMGSMAYDTFLPSRQPGQRRTNRVRHSKIAPTVVTLVIEMIHMTPGRLILLAIVADKRCSVQVVVGRAIKRRIFEQTSCIHQVNTQSPVKMMFLLARRCLTGALGQAGEVHTVTRL